MREDELDDKDCFLKIPNYHFRSTRSNVIGERFFYMKNNSENDLDFPSEVDLRMFLNNKDLKLRIIL